MAGLQIFGHRFASRRVVWSAEIFMRIAAKANLVYQFAYPTEVLLLIEAAHSTDQTILSESLSISPHVDIVRKDDPATG